MFYPNSSRNSNKTVESKVIETSILSNQFIENSTSAEKYNEILNIKPHKLQKLSDEIQLTSRVYSRIEPPVENSYLQKGFNHSTSKIIMQKSPVIANVTQKNLIKEIYNNKSYLENQNELSKYNYSIINSHMQIKSDDSPKFNSVKRNSRKTTAELVNHNIASKSHKTNIIKKEVSNSSEKQRSSSSKKAQISIYGISLFKTKRRGYEDRKNCSKFSMKSDLVEYPTDRNELNSMKNSTQLQLDTHKSYTEVNSMTSLSIFEEICNRMEAYTNEIASKLSDESQETNHAFIYKAHKTENGVESEELTRENLKGSNEFEPLDDTGGFESEISAQKKYTEEKNHLSNITESSGYQETISSPNKKETTRSLTPVKYNPIESSSSVSIKHSNSIKLRNENFANLSKEEKEKLEKYRRINLEIIKAVSEMSDATSHIPEVSSSVETEDSEDSELESLEDIRRRAAEEEEEEILNQCALKACIFLSQNYPAYFEHLIRRYQLNVYTPDPTEIRSRKIDVIRIASENRNKLERLEMMYCQRKI